MSNPVHPPDENHVHISAPGRRTGRVHRATLWFVSLPEGMELLAHRHRSGRRPDWLLNAVAEGRAKLKVGEWQRFGRLEPLHDTEVSRVLASFADKYGDDLVQRWYGGESLEAVRVTFL